MNKEKLNIIFVVIGFIFMFLLIFSFKNSLKIKELEDIRFEQHAEIQELKQTLHLIEMRNEGMEYIDELKDEEQ